MTVPSVFYFLEVIYILFFFLLFGFWSSNSSHQLPERLRKLKLTQRSGQSYIQLKKFFFSVDDGDSTTRANNDVHFIYWGETKR